MPGILNRLSSLRFSVADNRDKAHESSYSNRSRISFFNQFRSWFHGDMPLSRTFAEPSQELRVRKRSDTITLLGTAYQSSVVDVPSPPLPVKNFTVEDLEDRLIYADRVLRNSQRKSSPIRTRALQIYREACARLLDLEQEKGDLEAAKDIWRATVRTIDQSLHNTPCLRLANSPDAQILQDRLINLQKAALYARYADILTELCIQPWPGIGATERRYWSEISRKLQSEDDASYGRIFSGGQAHSECPTYLDIYRSCVQIGISRNDSIQTIREYATRNDLKYINIFPLIKGGKFDDLKKHLYHDSCIIPLLIHDNDWKRIRLLSRVLESLTELWFDRSKIDPENYQMWTYTKALGNLYRQLQGADYSVPQKQVACAVAKKIRKRLRDVEDEAKAIESLSMTIGPVRPSGNKRVKEAVTFSSSQLHAERERATKVAADWNQIMNLVHVAEDISNTSFGYYYEPAPQPLAIIPELSSER